MIDKHRIENEGWINARKEELQEERKQLEIDKVSVPVFLLFFGRRWSGKLRYRCLLPLERWWSTSCPGLFPQEKGLGTRLDVGVVRRDRFAKN